jgi:hypothetical protein
MEKPTLAPYVASFTIDDGFRLTSEPTIDAICNDIRHWHQFSLRGADMHLFGAFMCGVALLRARDIVPKASRGVTKKACGYSGFDGWKSTQFPEINETCLRNYTRFAENVFLQANDLSKTARLAVLQTGYKEFVCPTTREDASEILTAIGTAMDGKTMTEMYRSQKRIREALPKGGDMGNHVPRRTAAECRKEQGEKIAAQQLKHLTQTFDIWRAEKLHYHLSDDGLRQLQVTVMEFAAQINAFCKDRKV